MRGRGRGPARRLLLACTALAAACSPAEGPAERPPERQPVQVDASLGVVRVPAGSPVLVSIVLDSEDPEGLGPGLDAAFRAAVEDFGAVQQGFRVQLGTTIGTDCTRASGERVGNELAASAEGDGVVAVLGPQCTETLLGLQQDVERAGLVLMSPRAQGVTLTRSADGSPGPDRSAGTWRTAPSLLQEALAAAEHARELELARAVVVTDGSAGSSELAESFRIGFESLGGTVIAVREVDPAVTGDDPERATELVGALLDAVDAAQADVAFLPVGPDELLAVSGPWSRQTRLASIVRIATSVAASPALLAEEDALGLLFTGPVLAFSDATSAVTGMSASQTLERVRATSGDDGADGWWAYAYDAAALLLKAIEDTSLVDVDGSFVLSRAELRTALGRTTVRGLTGTLACTPLGDCGPTTVLLRSHEDPTLRALRDLPVVEAPEG